MSVYTIIEESELTSFLSNYDVDELIDFQGISDGIENTNYFVDTDRGRFVLTIFEQHSAHQVMGGLAHVPRDGVLVTTKDPEEFKAIITDRIDNSARYLHYRT